MNTVEFRIPLGPATFEFNTIDWSVCVCLTKIPERETIEFSAQTPSNYQVNNISHMPTENRIPPCLKLHCDSQIPNPMTHDGKWNSMHNVICKDKSTCYFNKNTASMLLSSTISLQVYIHCL